MLITRTIQLAYKIQPTFILICILIGVHRLMTRFMLNKSKYTLDGVFSELSCPLLLLWGDLDPWVDPAKANRIKEFYPKTSLVNLKAGHSPHDEVPKLANKALLDWLSSVALKSKILIIGRTGYTGKYIAEESAK